jgi:UDP-3-O-[3-hydroxymyristoyl] glucosamine N-acyltransferase
MQRPQAYRRQTKKIGFKLPVIIHPKAVVAKDVEIGEGVFVAAGSVINPGTRIGRNAIINTSSSVDHDCEIGDFVHVAPGLL